MNETATQFAKFVIVGAVNAAYFFGSLFFFTEVIGLWYGVSALVGYGGVTVIGFTLNKWWTFR